MSDTHATRQTMVVECMTGRIGSVRVEVPVELDDRPQEYVYLDGDQPAAAGTRYRRHRFKPRVTGDLWEYYPG